MLTVLLPRDLTDKLKDLSYLINIHETLLNVYSESVIFDFKNVAFMEANICAFLGALNEGLVSRKNVIVYKNVNSDLESVLKRNNYFKSNKEKKYIIPQNEDTVISYKSFKLNEEEEFNKYLEFHLFSKKYFPKHSKDLEVRIQRCIYELFDNSKIHGKCKLIHACGQFFPNSKFKRLHFSLVNLGNTIKNEVSTFLKSDLNGYECIEWALIKGNTTKNGNTSGGLGLDVLMKFIDLNSGYMQIISDNGFYEYRLNNIKKQILDYKFNGTLINLVFYMEDKSYYSFDNDSVTAQIIF